MKRCLALVIILGLAALPALAQQQDSTLLLENGTIIYLELSKSVDARKAKPGDEVRASLLANVLSHGKIVLRQDAKLIGHVTEAQAFSKEKPESRLGIVFDKVIGKGKQETVFQAMLMAISPAPRLQVAAIDAPPLPNFNPANPQLQDGHVPRPKQMTAPTPSSSKDPFRREENETLRTGYELGLQPTDIDGLSLASSSDGNRVVVSFKNNVKLESGVRLTLRVTAQNQKRSAAQAP